MATTMTTGGDDSRLSTVPSMLTVASTVPPWVCRSGRRHLHEHLAVGDAHGEAQLGDGRVVDVEPGGDVPAPGVPGTRHHAPIEIALAQRTATMSAGVVDGVEPSFDVEERQHEAAGLHDPPLAGGHIGPTRDPDSGLRHAFVLPA